MLTGRFTHSTSDRVSFAGMRSPLVSPNRTMARRKSTVSAPSAARQAWAARPLRSPAMD